MKTHHMRLLKFILAAMLLPLSTQASSMRPDDMRLPDDIKVYYSQKVGLTHKAYKGAKADVLPVNNDYKDSPGCYIACYSNHSDTAAKKGAYPVEGKTFVMGQVRVKGHYQGGICIPTGYENKSIHSSKEMKEVCEKSFPAMCEKGTCWANGKTSHWFY